MTQPDHFLLRWARLKRDSEARHKADFSGSLPPESAEAISAGAEAAAALAATRQRSGQSIDIRDTRIAGIVLARRAKFATRNIKHFSDLTIEIMNPWEATS